MSTTENNINTLLLDTSLQLLQVANNLNEIRAKVERDQNELSIETLEQLKNNLVQIGAIVRQCQEHYGQAHEICRQIVTAAHTPRMATTSGRA